MPAKLLDGAAVGDALRAELQGEIRRLKARGITPGLAAVLVGEDPASTTYVRMKGKACDEAGLYHETLRLSAETTERELQYPGQIKVVVIRETRAVDFAR